MPQKRIPTPTQDAGNWGTILNDHIAQTQNPLNGAFNSFDQFSARPTNLTTDDAGKTYLYTQTGNWHEWSGSEWRVTNNVGIYNVLDYGCVADNNFDNSIILQTLFNKLKNTSFSIYFPPSSNYYKFNTVVNIDNTKPFSILGAGSDVSKINAPNGAFYILGKVSSATQFYKDQVNISNLTINNLSSIFTATAIHLNSCNMNIDDVGINGKWNRCLDLENCWFSTVNKVYGTVFVDNSTEITNFNHGFLQGSFIYLLGSVSININNCQTYGFKYGFFASDQRPDNHYCEGITFYGCVAQFVDHGIYLEHGTLTSIQGCTLTQCTYSAVTNLAGIGTQITNSWLEGPTVNHASEVNAQTFVGFKLGNSTTSCSAIGNSFVGGTPGSKAFAIDGNNHHIALNRGNMTNSARLNNEVYGNGHYIFGNMGQGFEANSFSNGYTGRFSTDANILEYNDNTAAIAGGLRPGSTYRTGDNLKIVH